MTDAEKFTLGKGPPSYVVHLGYWLQKIMSTIKVILVAVLGLSLILFVRVFASLYGDAEAPEIDLRDIEK
jgi:hypothetical protein